LAFVYSSNGFKKDFKRLRRNGLVNISRFKPRTRYEKIMIVWMILAVSCYVVFNVSNLLFSQVCTLQTDTEKQCNVENTRLVWIASSRPICWPFSTLVWVSTHILGTTGLHQRTKRCVKLQRQLFLTCSAEPWW